MILHSIHDDAFIPYGMPLPSGYDFEQMIRVLEGTDAPEDGVVYVPSVPELESLPVFYDLRDRLFGGLEIQAGYCNGTNTTLNCLERHRGIEALVAADDIILMLAKKEQVAKDNTLDTGNVEAFLVKKGEAVLYYETTMHYAPARAGGTFHTAIVLVKGTNTDRPRIRENNDEDETLFARNKWLLAHPDSPEAANDGAFVGLTGKNLDILTDLD